MCKYPERSFVTKENTLNAKYIYICIFDALTSDVKMTHSKENAIHKYVIKRTSRGNAIH